ncbi:hypothetical protein SISSUDRAFT_1067859 [Sistotremastrum suecicum HHB10207 ss-3]|uniref:Uncharacterized protein n=1 Tax=Sistotremastrum suecicum HHB10207 ss-3 TaxID=1314776 RepID=A0A165WM49_9AGAM|nr:hypothetical protein SISSUDRAFT_1067859 [Sistotremastrum suecicum HHB10207 ss-3]
MSTAVQIKSQSDDTSKSSDGIRPEALKQFLPLPPPSRGPTEPEKVFSSIRGFDNLASRTDYSPEEAEELAEETMVPIIEALQAKIPFSDGDYTLQEKVNQLLSTTLSQDQYKHESRPPGWPKSHRVQEPLLEDLSAVRTALDGHHDSICTAFRRRTCMIVDPIKTFFPLLEQSPSAAVLAITLANVKSRIRASHKKLMFYVKNWENHRDPFQSVTPFSPATTRDSVYSPLVQAELPPVESLKQLTLASSLFKHESSEEDFNKLRTWNVEENPVPNIRHFEELQPIYTDPTNFIRNMDKRSQWQAPKPIAAPIVKTVTFVEPPAKISSLGLTLDESSKSYEATEDESTLRAIPRSHAIEPPSFAPLESSIIIEDEPIDQTLPEGRKQLESAKRVEGLVNLFQVPGGSRPHKQPRPSEILPPASYRATVAPGARDRIYPQGMTPVRANSSFQPSSSTHAYPAQALEIAILCTKPVTRPMQPL